MPKTDDLKGLDSITIWVELKASQIAALVACGEMAVAVLSPEKSRLVVDSIAQIKDSRNWKRMTSDE